MVHEEDVNEAASSSAEPETPDTGTVTPDTKVDDRPAKNIIAEYNRKMTKVERQQAQMAEQLTAIGQFLAANHQQSAPPVPARTTQQEPDTDEILWARAQSGDRLAFEEYQRRIEIGRASCRERVCQYV